MGELVKYPPLPGDLRKISEYLIDDTLSGYNADYLIQKGYAWHTVAPFVHESKWWNKQQVSNNIMNKLNWEIVAKDATVMIHVNGRYIVVDPGPHFHIKGDEPDLIVITHAHHDHTGGLSKLTEDFPYTPVLMTELTARLLRLSPKLSPGLRDCLDHRTIHQDFLTPRDFGWCKTRFLHAGHLLGAAMIELEVDHEIGLVTGDYALRDVGGYSPSYFPEKHGYSWVAMAVTSDAIKGSLPFANPENNRRAILEGIAQAFNQGSNRVTLPVQALGQAQECFAALILAQQAGSFLDVDIKLDGFAATVSRLYYEQYKDRDGVWKLPFENITDSTSQKSIMITSPSNNVSFNKIKPESVIVDVPVYTHASWGEHMTLAVGSRAENIYLYHGSSLSLYSSLQKAGQKVSVL